MIGHDPIAYTFEADTHCPACTEKRFGRNERGFIAESPTTDREGNPIGAIFSWDASEWDDTGIYCGDCFDEIHAAKGEPTMNNDSSHDEYTLDSAGRITDPGKFEGSPAYVPYFWNFALDGGGEDHFDYSAFDATGEPGQVISFFKFDAEDRENFPDLAKFYGISVYSDEDGFVHCSLYADIEEYEETMAVIDTTTAIDAEDEAREQALADALDELKELEAAETGYGPCEQCCVARINGTRCHELGCPVYRKITDLRKLIKKLEDY